MNLGLEYIKYRWNAKGRGSIHSAFVSNLVENCLSIKLEHQDSTTINSLISKLQASTESIEIEDFGAGSKKLGNIRSIPAILKTSSSKGKYGDFLYQICNHYQFNNILEFGTSLGIGSINMALGNKGGQITTIEACKNTRAVALNNFEQLNLKNIESVYSTFSDFLNIPSDKKYDLIYIDGHHDGSALLDYMERLKNRYHDKTIFILDDIRWSSSMLEAWETLKNNKEFHISVDLFRFGILVPLSSEEKGEYSIKL